MNNVDTFAVELLKEQLKEAVQMIPYVQSELEAIKEHLHTAPCSPTQELAESFAALKEKIDHVTLTMEGVCENIEKLRESLATAEKTVVVLDGSVKTLQTSTGEMDKRLKKFEESIKVIAVILQIITWITSHAKQIFYTLLILILVIGAIFHPDAIKALIKMVSAWK